MKTEDRLWLKCNIRTVVCIVKPFHCSLLAYLYSCIYSPTPSFSCHPPSFLSPLHFSLHLLPLLPPSLHHLPCPSFSHAGLDMVDSMEEQVQLSAVVKVKETGLVSLWTKRFCILIASKLFVFSSTTPKGKPHTTLALYGSTVEEYHHKKHGYGLSIVQPQRNKTMYMVFGGLAEQSKWMKRMQKVRTFIHLSSPHGAHSDVLWCFTSHRYMPGWTLLLYACVVTSMDIRASKSFLGCVLACISPF